MEIKSIAIGHIYSGVILLILKSGKGWDQLKTVYRKKIRLNIVDAKSLGTTARNTNYKRVYYLAPKDLTQINLSKSSTNMILLNQMQH